MVKGLPEERTIALAHYMVDSGATVRQAAARFGVSKSTVHKDITTRLKRQNAVLYGEEARKRETAASRASRTQNKTGRPEGKPVPQI